MSEAKRLLGLEEEKAKLQRLLAELMLDNAGLKALLGGKMVTPPWPGVRRSRTSGRALG